MNRRQPEPVGCAIIGLGAMGSLHAGVLARSGRADVLVCCDIDPDKEHEAVPSARFTSDVAEAMSYEGVSAAVIATPSDRRRGLVVEALGRGLHVLCEKPIAATAEDADAIVRAADAAEGILAVGHLLRFDPRYLAVKRGITNGSLGEPISMAASRTRDVRGKGIYGKAGGLAVELGVHDLDVLQWLAGDIERVYAEVNEDSEGIAQSLAGSIRFRSRAVASIELSWALAADAGLVWQQHLSYVGTSGFSFVDTRSGSVQTHLRGGATLADTVMWSDLYDGPAGVIADQDEYFLRCVQEEGRDWVVSPAEARSALVAAIALDRSALEKRPVTVGTR